MVTVMRKISLMCFLLLTGLSSTVVAGWEQLSKEELESVVNNKTWVGKGFSVYWNENGKRKLVTQDKDYVESWVILEEAEIGALLCAGAGSSEGERCGLVEAKKGKYRSIRIRPNAGKKFRFKIKDGIPDF